MVVGTAFTQSVSHIQVVLAIAGAAGAHGTLDTVLGSLALAGHVRPAVTRPRSSGRRWRILSAVLRFTTYAVTGGMKNKGSLP